MAAAPALVPGVGALACCPGCGLRFVLPPAEASAEAAPAETSPPKPPGQILPVSAPSSPAVAPAAPAAPARVATPAGPGKAAPPAPAPAAESAAVASAPPAATPAYEPPVGDPDKPTVLIVEDLDFYTALVKSALGGRYQTIAVATVAAALEALRHQPVDLMVLDLTLKEGEDGRDILRALDEKPCPILVFSAKDESEMYGTMWEELQRLGADDMLIKGMNVEENLLQKVTALLGSE